MKPQYKNIFHTWFGLLALAVLAIIANSKFEGTYYLYLNINVPVLPTNPILKVAVLAIVVLAVFHLMYFLFNMVDKRKRKI